jgi:hypothetical protein
MLKPTANHHELTVSGDQFMLMIFHLNAILQQLFGYFHIQHICSCICCSRWLQSINQKLHIANHLTTHCPMQNISKLSQSFLPSTTEGYIYMFRSSLHITLHPNKDIPEVDWGRSDFQCSVAHGSILSATPCLLVIC